MDQVRKDAAERGDVRYQGAPCIYQHSGERYVSSGACVQCVKDRAVKKRVEGKPIMGAAEIEALMLRGGPNDRETAIAAGAKWYNNPGGFTGVKFGDEGASQRCGGGLYIHGIVGVDGFCPLCGGETPEPVTVKQELDLAAKLLS